MFEGYENRWYFREQMEGIEVVRVKTFIAPNEGTLKRILDFTSYMATGFTAGLFQSRPDVVVASSPQIFTAVGGWALGNVRGVPHVLELADLWPASIVDVGALSEGPVLSFLQRMELFLYRKSHSVVALTRAFKRDLTARGIEPEKIAVVINGVETSSYSPRPRHQQLEAEHGLDGCFVIGYLGTFGMAHALMNVLDAAEILAKEAPHIRYLLVGAGAEREKLVRAQRERGLKNVLILPQVSKDVVADYWSLCDVGLVHLKNRPTFATVIPSKIWESIGMGLPVLLASPKGEASEIIEGEGFGVWVPAEDPRALADASSRLAADEASYQTLKQQAIKSAPLHSREKQARDMLTVLERVARTESEPVPTELK